MSAAGSLPGIRSSGGDSSISIVIPTYRRGAVLLDTLRHLLALTCRADEILVVDQTEAHDREIAGALTELETGRLIRRIPWAPPSIPAAMNKGLLEAKHEIVLFLDDDIVPGDDLITSHQRAYSEYPEAWAVAGRVLQPEDRLPQCETHHHGAEVRVLSGLRKDFDFPFNGPTSGWISNVMAGNLSVKREKFLRVGGFDENFVPPVSYRFETEFARRLVAAGGRIRFEPRACIRHLRMAGGGTRSRGSHLTSFSPLHGVGDYYYALRWGKGWSRLVYLLNRPFREVRTRFHLTHPWYIPVKFLGELRALAMAFRLRREPKFLVAHRK